MFRIMKKNEMPTKAFVSVSEMTAALDLSRARFYQLLDAQILPQPVYDKRTEYLGGQKGTRFQLEYTTGKGLLIISVIQIKYFHKKSGLGIFLRSQRVVGNEMVLKDSH